MADNAPLLDAVASEPLQESLSSSDTQQETVATPTGSTNQAPTSPRRLRVFKLPDVPEFLRGNDFILDGYRVDYNFYLTLKSMFSLHNETFNIWSHFLGFVGFFIGAFVVLFLVDDATPGDIITMLLFFIGAQCQMLFSAVFHLFCCLNIKAYTTLAKLDYTGITMMVAGSMVPVAWFGFACEPFWKIFYIVCVTVFSTISMVLSLLPFFQTNRFLYFRTGFFLLFGLSGIVPMVHLATMHGNDYWVVMSKLIVMGTCYVIGAVIFASKVPERFYPGKFDFWWSSHQIWHIFTIIAACAQLWGVICAFQFKREHSC